MALSHAVVWLDHHNANVHRFDAEQSETKHVKAHTHSTGQHNSGVRTEHEFFGEVCDALADIPQVVVAAAHIVQADFRHYVEKHRPAVGKQIARWETVGNVTDGELVALGRKFLLTNERATEESSAS